MVYEELNNDQQKRVDEELEKRLGGRLKKVAAKDVVSYYNMRCELAKEMFGKKILKG